MSDYLDQTNESRNVLITQSQIRDNTYISVKVTDEDGESFPVLLDRQQVSDLTEQLIEHLIVNIRR